MNVISRTAAAAALVAALVGLSNGAPAQPHRHRRASSPAAAGHALAERSRLTGVYRLDVASSDKLYSAIAGASSNLPFEQQQRFFIDLAIRLAPPDQLAIEQRGINVSIASSRAPRITFQADGRGRAERTADGQTVRTRAMLNGNQLIVSTSGGSSDRFTAVFESLDDGRRLRVTRRIHAEQLNQPLVVQSFYDKISEVAHWGIYGEPQVAPTNQPTFTSTSAGPSAAAKAESDEALTLRAALNEWIAATNARDIDRQMTFYLPTVAAFYLARNVSRDAVRAEKVRVFRRANALEVRADEPEIIFRDGGRAAIMRFRKRYTIEGGGQNRRGEVVQELRWQRTNEGWRIFSERDVKVIR